MQKWLLLFICCGLHLCADNSYWNADQVREYVHHSELQRRWAIAFLAPHLKALRGDENILDIGCGDGKISADISKFVPRGTVLGVDPSQAMIAWGVKQHHSVEYPNLTFREGGFLNPNVSAPVDLIVSFCAMQHCPDQQAAIESLASLLTPGGKLLILVPAMNNEAWNEARARTQGSPKWNSYWKNFVPRKFLTPEKYTELLTSAGFSKVKVGLIKTKDPFINRAEIIDWLMGTFAPVVPKNLARDFYNEWIDTYLSISPQSLSSDGVIYASFDLISMEAILL